MLNFTCGSLRFTLGKLRCPLRKDFFNHRILSSAIVTIINNRSAVLEAMVSVLDQCRPVMSKKHVEPFALAKLELDAKYVSETMLQLMGGLSAQLNAVRWM